jgi:hypothetical protein
MRVKLCLLTLILAGFFTACTKQNDLDPVAENTLQMERPTNIPLLNLSGLDIKLPQVPERPESEVAGARANISVATDESLQDAINNAPKNSTITLEAGTHTLSATLLIDHKVKLKGESGAILSLGGTIGILISAADGTKISDLEIVSESSQIGLAIVNSDHVTIKDNSFSGIVYSVVLEQANYAKIHSNEIVGGAPSLGHGIVVVNGDHVSLKDNDISNNVFGIWACDNDGKAINNNTHNNTIGVILCNVPSGSFPLGDGDGGSEFPCTNWTVTNNTSNNNFWGYLVIDGSNNNTLSNNSAGDNLLIDMELADETLFTFGFLTPVSEENTVNVGGADINIIDCGLNNVINGGTAASGPCSP